MRSSAAAKPLSETAEVTGSPLLGLAAPTRSFWAFLIASVAAAGSDIGSGQPCGAQVEERSPCPRF